MHPGTPEPSPHADAIHGAGTDDPELGLDRSLADRRPVLVAFLFGALPMVAAFVLAVLEVVSGVPAWVIATLTGIGPLSAGLAALWAQAKVTPLANPRDDDGDPLVPVPVDRA